MLLTHHLPASDSSLPSSPSPEESPGGLLNESIIDGEEEASPSLLGSMNYPRNQMSLSLNTELLAPSQKGVWVHTSISSPAQAWPQPGEIYQHCCVAGGKSCVLVQ